jgi:hypothetical protein
MGQVLVIKYVYHVNALDLYSAVAPKRQVIVADRMISPIKSEIKVALCQWANLSRK